MDEKFEVSFERVKKIIDSFSTNTFTTADILRKYSGGFLSNRRTPAVYSFNAQYGKLLKRNEKFLNIVELKSGIYVKDDFSHNTATSVWRIIG